MTAKMDQGGNRSEAPKLEPQPGIEHGSAAYKAAASPQCFRGVWCWQGGSNTRPPLYENGALPTELCQRNGLIDDGAGSAERRGLVGAPTTCTAPSSNIWTFTMKNSPAPRRQITQETLQTHELRQPDAWLPVTRAVAARPRQLGAHRPAPPPSWRRPSGTSSRTCVRVRCDA